MKMIKRNHSAIATVLLVISSQLVMQQKERAFLHIPNTTSEKAQAFL